MTSEDARLTQAYKSSVIDLSKLQMMPKVDSDSKIVLSHHDDLELGEASATLGKQGTIPRLSSFNDAER